MFFNYLVNLAIFDNHQTMVEVLLKISNYEVIINIKEIPERLYTQENYDMAKVLINLLC